MLARHHLFSRYQHYLREHHRNLREYHLYLWSTIATFGSIIAIGGSLTFGSTISTFGSTITTFGAPLLPSGTPSLPGQSYLWEHHFYLHLFLALSVVITWAKSRRLYMGDMKIHICMYSNIYNPCSATILPIPPTNSLKGNFTLSSRT